jgi:hypothetical protein
VSTAATANLNPVLVPDRDAQYRLRGVYESIVDGCRDELVLAFDGASLTFRADPDTDTLESRFAGTEFRPSPDHRPLSGSAFDRAAGTELGWSWLALNQQGYCDSALLSFGGITPNILVHVIGSSIRVFGIDVPAV